MEERHKPYCNYEDCMFKDKIIKTSEDVSEMKGDIKALSVRINGSLEKISSFMETGFKWRMTILALSVTILLSVCGVIYTFGTNQRQIEINTQRLDIIEQQQHLKTKGE